MLLLPATLYLLWHYLLAAELRRSNADAAAGALEKVARIVAQIRRRWPRTQILLQCDCDFTCEALMAWYEANRLDYVFGLARNDRLEQALIRELITATAEASAPAGRHAASRTSATRRSTPGVASAA